VRLACQLVQLLSARRFAFSAESISSSSPFSLSEPLTLTLLLALIAALPSGAGNDEDDY